jgi:hypothetical protein
MIQSLNDSILSLIPESLAQVFFAGVAEDGYDGGALIFFQAIRSCTIRF